MNIVGKNIKEIKLFNSVGKEIAKGTKHSNHAAIINVKKISKGCILFKLLP